MDGGGGRCVFKTKKFFDRDFEHSSQPQRNQCIGDVATGLHRVDGLPADTNFAGEGGGRIAAFLTDVTQGGFQYSRCFTRMVPFCHERAEPLIGHVALPAQHSLVFIARHALS